MRRNSDGMHNLAPLPPPPPPPPLLLMTMVVDPPPLNEEDNSRRLQLLFCASLIMLPSVVHRRLHLHLFSCLCPHTSSSRWVPLVQLVVAFPGALASPSHCVSARCLSFCHSSHLHLLLHPLVPQLVVTLPGASPPPPLIATPPGDASRCTPLVWMVCCIAIARWLIIWMVVMFPLITLLLPVHLRLSIRTVFGIVRGAHPSSARGLPHCCS